MNQLIKNIILFIVPFLMGIIVLFLIPVNKNFSYHFVKGECDDKASWIYHRIFEEEKSIDIAFTGASQTSCVIMDEYIEKELIYLSGKAKNVANLGYCRRGRDIQYVMLKELFRYKKPSVLVIEVAEDEPKKSHPVFPYLAESKDLWSSFIIFNQRYLLNIWKGIVVRFEYLKSRLFQNEIQSIHDQPQFGYIPSDQVAPGEVLFQNKKDWQNRISNTKSASVRNIELNYSKHYLEKIVQLAQNNNCKVLFLYLPESGSEMKTPLLQEYYKDLGELIILPDSIISNHSNWKDATHFNDSGAMKVSQLIVSELSKSD
jgi:hypothetical protein